MTENHDLLGKQRLVESWRGTCEAKYFAAGGKTGGKKCYEYLGGRKCSGDNAVYAYWCTT